MTEPHLKNVVEAALLAAGRALTIDELGALFSNPYAELRDEIRGALQALGEEYATRGIELKEVASGFRIQVRSAVAEPVSKLWQERPPKFSRAMLETLALVAYRQPITRGEIEQIRGVTVNPGIIKTLLERTWIRVVGHRDVPGKPELLGTTKEFLDYFGLKKLDDLPTLAELKQLEDLRVQLALPGAEPAVIDDVQPALLHEALGDDESAGEGADAAQDAASNSELESAGEFAAAEGEPERAQFLVAHGPDRDHN